MTSTPPRSALSVIHTAQGIFTLLGHAWQLLRSHMGANLKTLALPMALASLCGILLAIPSSQMVLTLTSLESLLITLACFLLGGLFGLAHLIALTLAGGLLCRFYYCAIVEPQAPSLKSCWQFINRIKFRLLLLGVGSVPLLILCLIVNLLIWLVGGFIALAAITTLGSLQSLGGSPLLGIMLVLFLLIWGFVVITVCLALGTAQLFVLAVPFLATITAPWPEQDALKWRQRIGRGYRLVFRDIFRLLSFSLAFFGMSVLLSAVLNSPAVIWGAWEAWRLSLSDQHTVPLHVNVIINIWNSLTALVWLPFYLSAASLFWYDCQVRHEGLDLHLWFEDLAMRHGVLPEEQRRFLT